MTVRSLDQPRGWAYATCVAIVKPSMLVISRRRWIDGEKIPATGGCVVVPNHLSHLDPLSTAHLIHDHGRVPRYLAKSSLFTNPRLGAFLRSAGQIPVERLSKAALGAYAAAVDAVRAGECVVVFPEGTLTRDPELWPMRAKTGAARIALATGCPVVPVGHWGVQELLAPYARRPALVPRKTVTMKVGDPVDLTDLEPAPGEQPSTEAIDAATRRIMDAITAIVADLRGEEPPATRFDPAAAGLPQIGNPDRAPRESP